MNINPNKIKQLVELFAKLDDEYQNKAISLLLELHIEQAAESQYRKENDKKKGTENTYLKEQSIKERKQKRINEICSMLELMDKMDSTQLASIAIAMEKLKLGTFTKQDDITITINSKQVSIEEYLKTVLPEADIIDAKNFVDENLNN